MKANFTKKLREANSKYMQARSDFVKANAKSKKDHTFEASECERATLQFDEQKKRIEGLLFSSLYAFGSAEYIFSTVLSIIASLC